MAVARLNPAPARVKWPTSLAVCTAVATRVNALLAQHEGPVADVARIPLRARDGILSERPHSLTAVMVAGCCLAAGGDWHRALWPAAAMELMMAAADVLDDLGDDELEAYQPRFGRGVVLTAAAGMLTLASQTLLRSVEDGVSPARAVALGQLFGEAFTRAAGGQAAGLGAVADDVAGAYDMAASKSGPLGALISVIGARTATDDDELLEQFRLFGWHLGVSSQLFNDARDAAPDGSPAKSDVRDGARTVPLVFSGSRGAPAGLDGDALARWEQAERRRIHGSGGVMAAYAMGLAERMRAQAALDQLDEWGCPTEGLAALLR